MQYIAVYEKKKYFAVCDTNTSIGNYRRCILSPSVGGGGGGGVTRVSEWIRIMGLQSLPSPGIGLGFHSK